MEDNKEVKEEEVSIVTKEEYDNLKLSYLKLSRRYANLSDLFSTLLNMKLNDGVDDIDIK